MKVVLRSVAGVFVAGVVLSLGMGNAAAAGNAPKIEVTPSAYDFGTVDEGVRPKAVFTIKNAGDAQLVIFDAKPSCGCTVANLSSKQIAPGEKATLEAVYNSQNANGPVHKSVNVRSNDPKNPSVDLPITGIVKAMPAPDITLSVYNVTNLQLAAGGSDARSIRVTNTGQMDLVINEISATPGATAKLGNFSVNPGQLAKTDLTLKPGESATLDITISPSMKAGNFQEFVTIRSNAKRRPVVTFIAQGTVQG